MSRTKKHAIYELDLVEVVEVNKEFVIARKRLSDCSTLSMTRWRSVSCLRLNIPVSIGMIPQCVPKPSAFGDIDGGFKGKKE